MKVNVKPAIQFANKGALRLCVEAESEAERLVLFQLRKQLEAGGVFVCERSEENGYAWGFSICQPPDSFLGGAPGATVVLGDGFAADSPRSRARKVKP